MKVAFLDLKKLNINLNDIKEQLAKKNIIVGYLSDEHFCPYLICFKTPDKELSFMTINEGFYSRIAREYDLIYCNDIESFISTVSAIKEDKLIQNALF